MRTTVLVLAVLIGCGGKGAPAPTNVDDRGEAAAGMPAEVDELVGRWDLCVHWAGEEPYDDARRAEIEQGVADSCPGNEDTRAALEARYADRPDVLARLRALDDM